MRQLGAFLGVMVLLFWALGVQAQQSSFFTTAFNPPKINFKPIDVTNAMKPINMTNAFKPPAKTWGSGTGPFTTTNMANLFRKLTLNLWPPRTASTPILPAFSTPFQPPPTPITNPLFPFK